MPFTIITTHGPKGFPELTLVPEGWVQSTSTGKSCVYWPKVGITKVINDENSIPSSGWTRQACLVKKTNICSVQQGHTILSEMSGEETDDACSFQNTYRQRFAQKALANSNKINARPVDLPQKEMSQSQNSNEVFDSNVSNEILNEVTELPNCTPEITRNKNLPVSSGFVRDHNSANTNQLANSEAGMITIVSELIKQIRDINSNKVVGADKIDKLTQVVEQQIVPTLAELVEEVKQLKKSVNVNTAQLNRFMNSVEIENRKRKTPSFSMDPIENIAELQEFEKRLEEKEFKTKVLDWMNHSISETNSYNRMLDAMDMLLTREFCTQISWSGQGKESKKIAMRMFPNTLEIFKEIGTTNFCCVTDENVKMFFISKFKHSKQRCEILGLRKPTSHNKRV